MATISLLLTADDKASPVLKRLGDSAKKIGAGMAAGAAVAGAAAVGFGIDSVKAYAEAEEAQKRLADAFARFPALAGTNQRELQKWNSELQKKTKYDDDAIASAQATLAAFDLNADQLKELTPLMLDYASKSGKDVVTAAEDMGKAMLGQGRTLKTLGIEFTDSGSQIGNYNQLVDALRDKVGGFAELEGTTAAGKLEILRNRFGEVQETIGGALMPALDGLVEWLNGDGMVAIEGLSVWLAEDAIPGFQDLVAWVIEYKDILGPAAGALGVLTGAQWVLNAAMAANPVGIVIMGLAAIIALGTLIVTNWNDVTKIVYSTTGWVVKGLMGIALGAAAGIESVINALLGGIARVAQMVNPILKLIGLPTINLPTSVKFTDTLANLAAGFNSQLDYASKNGIGGLQSKLGGGVSGGGDSTRRQSSTLRGGGTPGGARGGIRMPAFADGGAVMSATIALIGEGTEPEGVIPLSKFPEMVKAAGYGGDGSQGNLTVQVHLQGITTRTEGELGREVVKAIRAAEDQGKIRKGTLNG